MRPPYQNTTFLLSAAEVNQLPPDVGVEVAIVGRSNAGKSSVLNCLTHNRKLARVSKTPGRTQLLNVFLIDPAHRLIDLPGYGFASAPLAAKKKWESAIQDYFTERESLKGVLLIMDIRHPLKELDLAMLEFCEHDHIPLHILLNKADKLSTLAANKILKEVKDYLKECATSVSVQLFSALKNDGLKVLHQQLNEWYGW